jgi:hypothetical protein
VEVMMDKQTEKVIERTWSKETIMQVELGIMQNMLGSRTEVSHAFSPCRG